MARNGAIRAPGVHRVDTPVGTVSCTLRPDGKGGTASAAVSITVTAVVANRPPVAQNDAFTVNQDSAANSFNVLANDADPDGDALTISAVGTAGHGTATISGNRVSYTPGA